MSELDFSSLEPKLVLTLDPGQKRALVRSVKYKVFAVNGVPGAGKSTWIGAYAAARATGTGCAFCFEKF